MAAASSETTPLLPTQNAPNAANSSKPVRSVTFNPTVSMGGTPPKPNVIQGEGGQPMLAALNNKLRRRHSQGSSMLAPLPTAPKIGAQRTTKHAQKLKLLPDPDHGEDGPDEESGREVYSQFTRIKDPSARRDAARLGKEDRERLPRVTAYCTASSYRLEELMKYLRSRGRVRGAQPKLFDECIYSPYNYSRDLTLDATPSSSRNDGGDNNHPQLHQRRYSDSAVEVDENTDTRREDVLHEINTQAGDTSLSMGENRRYERSSLETIENPDFDTRIHTPEVFLFEYGTVVIWGMTVKEEQRFLKEIAKFETEKLGPDDVQVEAFNYYYTTEYQARIYNDFISLRDRRNYMTKLAISHALAQSVKTSLYEDLVDNTIEETKEVPSQIATTGKVNMSRKEINMQIGELFILRINIHLQGSVLDSPELMWAEPHLDPIYQAVRSYLEMNSRVKLLTERLDVIADLLQVLKDQLTHTHGESLEWIVIVLIAAEILVAAINIFVDLYAGVD